MRLSNLKLKNFRNYHETKLEFSPNVNVLIGENAQGKTNLLESIYVLAMTKSHRTTNDRELIEFSEKSSFLEGIVEKKTGNLRLSLALSKKGQGQFFGNAAVVAICRQIKRNFVFAGGLVIGQRLTGRQKTVH